MFILSRALRVRWWGDCASCEDGPSVGPAPGTPAQLRPPCVSLWAAGSSAAQHPSDTRPFPWGLVCPLGLITCPGLRQKGHEGREACGRLCGPDLTRRTSGCPHQRRLGLWPRQLRGGLGAVAPGAGRRGAVGAGGAGV